MRSLVPVCLALLGPATTGRLGLALFLANGVLMLALAPAAARVPELGRLAAARAWPMFDDLARLALRLTLRTGALVYGALCLGVAAVAVSSGDVAARLSAPSWLLLLALSGWVSLAIQAIAAALRAGGREDFLAPSVIGSALLLPALLLGAHWGGATGLCAAHLLLNGGSVCRGPCGSGLASNAIGSRRRRHASVLQTARPCLGSGRWQSSDWKRFEAIVPTRCSR